MPFFSPSLPTHTALSLFYRVSAVFAIAIVAIFLIGYLRSRRVPGSTSHFEGLPDRSRQWLLYGLGFLWLLDGFLQAQPLMITRFIGGTLAPLLTGQPIAIAWFMEESIKLWSVSPVLWNVLATFIQIGIGLGLLWGHPERGQRIALWASLGWGLIVWIGGEGVGGIFSGGGILTGAPGSVFLYMIAAAVLLAPTSLWRRPLLLRAYQWGMVSFFSLEAILQAWPGAAWWTSRGLKGYVLSMAEMPQPRIISAPLFAWAGMLGHHPILWNGVITGALIVLALLWAVWPKNWAVLLGSVFWIFVTWWFGQDFGVLGGMGTDPNSGALLLLGLWVYASQLGLVTLPQTCGSKAHGSSSQL